MLLSQMLLYKAWADRRTLDAVAHIDPYKQASSLAFARQQLNHMVRVEELFRARLAAQADPHGSTNTDDLPSLEELDSRLTASNRWLQEYAGSIGAAQSSEQIHFRFVDGKSGTLTREEAIFHLTNHGTYHRGAIGHALDLASAQRPADTYTVFIHDKEPERRIRPPQHHPHL